MARIDEVADGIFRISVQVARAPISFNQFLIVDDQPALIHTGHYPMYEEVRSAVAQVLDPARLRYVVIGHFEADECGGMDRFVAEAKDSVLVASALGASVNLAHWNYSGAVRGVREGEVLVLGRHRLRFLETPHVHHWDSLMAFEETTGSLFPADLFIQPGDQPPVVREDLSRTMCQYYRESGIFAAEGPVRQAVRRIERLAPRWIHPMHGGSLPEELVPRFIRALYEEEFAYQGKILGRPLPAE